MTDDVQPDDTVAAEASAAAVEADATNAGSGNATLSTDNGDYELTVPLPAEWKTRANRAISAGDFDQWAELVLSPDDFGKWLDADPRNRDVEKMFESWAESTGEALGKSSRSAGSSRSTRR